MRSVHRLLYRMLWSARLLSGAQSCQVIRGASLNSLTCSDRQLHEEAGERPFMAAFD